MVMTLAELVEPANWMDGAICRQVDPDLWFPEKGGSTTEAKAVCAGCDVRSECLAYALEHDEAFGIWGGLSVTERDRLAGRHRYRPETVAAPHDLSCPRCPRTGLTGRGLAVHTRMCHPKTTERTSA